MKNNFYLSETEIGQKILNFLTSLIKSHQKIIINFPSISSVSVTLFWITGMILRHTVSWPLITEIELIVGSVLFTILTLGQKILKWRFFNYTILILTLSQAMIMGLNKDLILIGIIFTFLSAGHFIGMFYKQILNGLQALLLLPLDQNSPEIKYNKSIILPFFLISIISFILFSISYTSPGLDSNQQVYLGASFLSSFHDSFIDKFSKVWEIKPVFHRAYVYMFYKLATIKNNFLNKTEFESSVYFFYGLWTSLMITVGIIAGRKKLCNFSKLPLWAIIILGISMQGVMAVKLFEAEEMSFSFSVLGMGLLLSEIPILVFLVPFIFLYITLLKGVTLLIPVSLVFFAILLFKFKKSDYISFAIGSLTSLIFLFLFFFKYPVFVQEYSDAGTLQQSTVLFSAIIRLVTSIGAIAKGLYYNTYITIGTVLIIVLLNHFRKTKNYRYFAAMLILWTSTTLIPIVLGKGFTYYALPLAIASFLTILTFTNIYSQLNIKEIFNKSQLKTISLGFLVAFLILLFSEKPIILFTFIVPVVILFSTIRMYKMGSVKKISPLLLILLIISSANAMWTLSHQSWKGREASYLGDYKELTDYLKQNPKYLNEEMLYLTYGREAYYLGLNTPNRYFYTLVMRRHLHMEKLIKTDNKYLKVFKQSAVELKEMILNTNIMECTINDILDYNGKYILHSNNGWCEISLYPNIEKHIEDNYKVVLTTKKHSLYERITN